MVPAEGSLVDFGEGESAALIGVCDVGEVIVEIVKALFPPAVLAAMLSLSSKLCKLCQCWAFVSRGDKRLWM